MGLVVSTGRGEGGGGGTGVRVGWGRRETGWIMQAEIETLKTSTVSNS